MVSAAATMTTKTGHQNQQHQQQHQELLTSSSSSITSASSSLSSSSSSSSSSSTSPPCCCDECGLVKKDMKNVKDELRFLTHQVSQLMHVFSIKFCPCQNCSIGHESSAKDTIIGNQIIDTTCNKNRINLRFPNFDLDKEKSTTACNDQLERQNVKDQLIDVAQDNVIKSESSSSEQLIIGNNAQSRKRSHPPDSVIGVDQLLPKLLATKDQTLLSLIESRKSSSDTTTSSVESNVTLLDDFSINNRFEDQRLSMQARHQREQQAAAAAFYGHFPPPLRKYARHDFAHMGLSFEKRLHGPSSNIEQSCFLTKQISPSLGVTSVELPKNCVDNFDMHSESGYITSTRLLPTVPSSIFMQNDDDRRHMQEFSPNLHHITGPGLPLVTYGPKASTFFCGVCKREFSNVYYKRHMIVHANARPHVCDVCGKRFNERSNMMKHRQRLHIP